MQTETFVNSIITHLKNNNSEYKTYTIDDAEVIETDELTVFYNEGVAEVVSDVFSVFIDILLEDVSVMKGEEQFNTWQKNVFGKIVFIDKDL